MFWSDAIDKGIALTKYRIKHMEKHGVGNTAMKEKEILKRQERHKQVRDEKLK